VRVAGLIVLALLVALLSYLAWLGAFASVAIAERPIGPFTFAFRELPKASPADVGRVTAELEREIRDAGVSDVKPLGVYAPDGSSQIGVSVPAEARPKLLALHDVQVRDLYAERGLVAEFPWRSPLSFLISYLRVNPAFERYRETHGYDVAPAWVLLDGGRIVNMMPVAARPPQ
jgi:hypothetical protein